MKFEPFKNEEEEEERLRKERDELIESLEDYEIPHDEKRFILKRINIITQKLLEKAKYVQSKK